MKLINAKVDATLDSLSTKSMPTASTVNTQSADNMVTAANMMLLNTENVHGMTGKLAGCITSRNSGTTTSGVSNQSPLTMLELSDIESENEER
jgi:hypothetical protein